MPQPTNKLSQFWQDKSTNCFFKVDIIRCVRLTIFIFLLSFADQSFAQSSQIDSLKAILPTMKEDTSRVKLFIELGNKYRFLEIDSSFTYFHKAIELAEKIDAKGFEADALIDVGINHQIQGTYDSTKQYFQKSLEIASEMGDRKRISIYYAQNAGLYHDMGLYDSAVADYFKCLSMAKELSTESGQAWLYNRLGVVYYDQGLFDEAVRYYLKALDIREKQGKKWEISVGYNNIGEIYRLQDMPDKALEYFEKALEDDPNFVLACAGLADSYLVLGNNGYIFPGEAYPKAREFALKALKMDKRLAEAHATLASIKKDYDWDWAGAEKEYKIALQLKPGYASAHHGYAFLLSSLGRHEEAIREIKTARILDPQSPRIMANVGLMLGFARKYNQALEELRRAIELYPEHEANYEYVSSVYTALGRYEEALASLQRYKEITGKDPIINVAHVYAKWGKKEEAEKLLKKIIEESEKTYIPPAALAGIYGVLGDFDRAFSLLEKAYSERDNRLQFLKVYFGPLRSDPRFKALLKRMNLD